MTKGCCSGVPLAPHRAIRSRRLRWRRRERSKSITAVSCSCGRCRRDGPRRRNRYLESAMGPEGLRVPAGHIARCLPVEGGAVQAMVQGVGNRDRGIEDAKNTVPYLELSTLPSTSPDGSGRSRLSAMSAVAKVHQGFELRCGQHFLCLTNGKGQLFADGCRNEVGERLPGHLSTICWRSRGQRCRAAFHSHERRGHPSQAGRSAGVR